MFGVKGSKVLLIKKACNGSIDLDRTAEEIIKLGNICEQYYVNDIVISSIFTKRNLNLTKEKKTKEKVEYSLQG